MLTLVPGCFDVQGGARRALDNLVDAIVPPELEDVIALIVPPETLSEFSRREDLDQDGLTDEQEEQLGTDLSDPDSDGDGIRDNAELQQGTDPNTPRRAETVAGLPSAFDALMQPGESRSFFRGSRAITAAYVRVMGLVRRETTLQIEWEQVIGGEPVRRATTSVTMHPRQYWYWGHDIGPAAMIADPIEMTVTHLTITVKEGGDSVFYSFVSSEGLDNGPRGLVPLPPILANGTYDFNLLMAHGGAGQAANWDSFVIMLERIAPEIQVIRTDVDGLGAVSRRAGQLSRFLLRQQVSKVYVIGHSMGGLDARYVLTEAAYGNPAFTAAADLICGVYTIATPHFGGNGLAEELQFIADLIDAKAPAAADLQLDSPLISSLNGAFSGDITIGDRTIPIVALVFHADDAPLPDSDGVIEVASQTFGDHVISDIPSTRGAGLGAGRHTPIVPSRADPELESFEVLGRILEDILTRRSRADSGVERE